MTKKFIITIELDRDETILKGGTSTAQWVWAPEAMTVDNLEWAFAIAKLYGCKVFSHKL